MGKRTKRHRRRRVERVETGNVATGENTGETSLATGGEPTGADASDTGGTGAAAGEEILMAPGVFQVNTVEIDPAALAAEAAAAVPPVGAEPSGSDATFAEGSVAPAGGATEEEILAGYVLVCDVVVGQGCDALVPNWNVTPAERGKLSGAIAKALLLWFPDQIIPPKYMALLAIAGVTFEIVNARRDPVTGKLKPARVLPAQTAKPAATAAAVGAG